MRPTDPSRVRAVAALAAFSALAVSLAGASGPRKKRVEADPPKVEEAVGDLTFIQAHSGTKLEGVGLVVGLENTGVDPPPSYYRQKLLDEMKKAGVENANGWLRDPRVSMVIVRMNVPAGVNTHDRLDAVVEVPPGGGTKSLAGGRLLECRLREVMVLGGVPKEGPEAATVQGPVMTGSAQRPDDVKAGRVLGGGRIRKEIPYQLILNDNRKSGRVAKMVETVVNQRFPQTKGVEQKGSAHAKTDQYLELKVPKVYHQNQDRFFRVVKLLPMVDSPARCGSSGRPSGRRSCSTRRPRVSPRCGSKGWGSRRPRRSRPVSRARTRRSASSRPRRSLISATPPAPTSWPGPPSASPSSGPTPSPPSRRPTSPPPT